MICPNCNYDNLHGSSRCEQCGAMLDEIIYEASQFPAMQDDKAENEIVDRVSEITSSLKDSLSLTPEEVNVHLTQLKKNLKLGQGDLRNRLTRFKESLKGRGADIFRHPDRVTLKNVVISFIAWAILRFTTPFHRRIVKFLLSPLGLLALLVIAIVYSLFEREIIFKMKEMKRGVTDDAVSQQRDQGTQG
ncbi:MAG: TFIIB-type zinc ribbon-containing protein [Candidatus Xenobiia bacterium LiM19]